MRPSNKPFVPVIRSLAEDDVYKTYMWQALLHAAPANQARYRFVCRNTPVFPLSELLDEVQEQLDWLCTLRYTESELEFMGRPSYVKSDFIDFLRIFQLQRRYIRVWAEGDVLCIEPEGPQIHVMNFEIYALAIVNELYFRRLTAQTPGGEAAVLAEGRARLNAKIALIREYEARGRLNGKHPFEFFDFSLRRRYSGAFQDEMVGTLAREIPHYFKGTSNVYLAQKHGLPSIGTMAHEYLQTYQAMGFQLRGFQAAALEGWVREFRGSLGIALTDVVGMDSFLRDFDLYFAKLFDGLRHDSGDPYVWAEKALAHYAKLKVDAHTKRLVFSDGLDLPRSLALYERFCERTQMGFGLGTNLGNDMGLVPLNIVLKLVTCNGQPTAKLPDSEGKTLCDDETFKAYLRQQFPNNV